MKKINFNILLETYLTNILKKGKAVYVVFLHIMKNCRFSFLLFFKEKYFSIIHLIPDTELGFVDFTLP